MIAAVYVLYVLTCLFLILVVLLQAGKGDGMGAAFGGGGSNTILGNRGAATFLSKLTVASAVLFMLLSIVLAYHSSTPGSRVGRGRVDASESPAAMGTPTPGEEPEETPLPETDETDETDEAVPDEAPVDDQAAVTDDTEPTTPVDEVSQGEADGTAAGTGSESTPDEGTGAGSEEGGDAAAEPAPELSDVPVPEAPGTGDGTGLSP